MKRITPATGVAREALPLVRGLQPGDFVTIALASDSAFWRQESYRAVSALASRLLGAAAYTLDGVTVRGSVIVTRLIVPREKRVYETVGSATRPTHGLFRACDA